MKFKSINLILNLILVLLFNSSIGFANFNIKTNDEGYVEKSIQDIRDDVTYLKVQLKNEFNLNNLDKSQFYLIENPILKMKHEILRIDLRKEGCFEGPTMVDCFDNRTLVINFLDEVLIQLKSTTQYSQSMIEWALTNADTYLMFIKKDIGK